MVTVAQLRPLYLGGVDPNARNLNALCADEGFRLGIGALHPDDAKLFQLPHFRQTNRTFSGEITPARVAETLHHAQDLRNDPFFENAIPHSPAHKKGLDAIRGVFGVLARKAGGLNEDFSQHVKVVMLSEDDYCAWRGVEGAATLGNRVNAAEVDPYIGLIVLPDRGIRHFFHAVPHEMMHCMSYTQTRFDPIADATPLFTEVRDGARLGIDGPNGDLVEKFVGLNEGLIEYFAANIRISLCDLLGVGGAVSYPLHVRLVQELLHITGEHHQLNQHAAFQRVFSSVVNGGFELFRDLRTRLRESDYRGLAAVVRDPESLKAFAGDSENFSHMLPKFARLEREYAFPPKRFSTPSRKKAAGSRSA